MEIDKIKEHYSEFISDDFTVDNFNEVINFLIDNYIEQDGKLAVIGALSSILYLIEKGVQDVLKNKEEIINNYLRFRKRMHDYYISIGNRTPEDIEIIMYKAYCIQYLDDTLDL